MCQENASDKYFNCFIPDNLQVSSQFYVFVSRTFAGTLFDFYSNTKMVYLKNTSLQFTHTYFHCRQAFWHSSIDCPVLPCAFYYFNCCYSHITYLYIYYLGTYICFWNEFIYIHSCDNNAYTDFLFCFFWELVFIRVIGIYIFLCLFLCTLLWRKTYNLVSTHTRTHSYKVFKFILSLYNKVCEEHLTNCYLDGLIYF